MAKTHYTVSIEVRPCILADARNFISQISDFIFWNLRFAICNPEGYAFVPEGLQLDRSFTANNPGSAFRPCAAQF